jgi:hypothetical protein
MTTENTLFVIDDESNKVAEANNSLNLLLEGMKKRDDPNERIEDEKEKNRQIRLEACGKKHSYVLTFDGEYKPITFMCGDHRVCDICREIYYEREILTRLNYAQTHLPLGIWLKFLYIEEESQEAFLKQITRAGGEHLRIPQPDNMVLIIHNTGREGKNLLEYVYWVEEYDLEDLEDIDLEFNQILQQVPRGKRISGKLGEKQSKPDEDEGDGEGETEDEDEETHEIKIPLIYSKTATPRDVNLAFNQAVAETQGIAVYEVKELEKAMFQRVGEWIKSLKERGHEAKIFYDFRNIKESKALLWNANENNGVSDVQIRRSTKDIDTYNLDKLNTATGQNYTMEDWESKPIVKLLAGMLHGTSS